MANGEATGENPFDGPLDPTPEHKVIGVCAHCREGAHIKVNDRLLCFPCAYSDAN